MNSKFGDWAIRIFAILYGCICIGLIIYDCTMNKQPQKEKECILNIVFENQTSYKDITICMIEKSSKMVIQMFLMTISIIKKISSVKENLKSL